jgi:hypothetical protein
MTNDQLYLAIGVPMLFNAGLIGIMLAYINAKFSGVDQRFASVDQRFADVDRRFAEMDRRFVAFDQKMDRRFDELRDLWRSELHRVEEVLDARLKHLEDR